MSKSNQSMSRKYLSIIGIAAIVLGVATIIMSFLPVMMNTSVEQLGIDGGELEKMRVNLDDNAIRMTYAIAGAIGGIFSVILGYLFRRASANPEKTTFLLIISVLECITNAIAIVTSITSNNISINLFVSIASLAIYAFALISIVNVRKEIDD